MENAAHKKPPFPLPQLEMVRALSELHALPLAKPLLRNVPRGDGHPVITLPGFLGSDLSTSGIRTFVRRKNYDMRPWTLGRNLGSRAIGEDGEILLERVLEVYQETGRKVSLVGWSLGGIMAREVAKQIPDKIRQVISMGSPFGGHPDSTTIGSLYMQITGQDTSTQDFEEMRVRVAEPPPNVPSTAIYSKTDGVASWTGCVEPKSDLTDNIEVHASHGGLVFNPFVLYLIADRLALPDGAWSPFNRDGEWWRQVAYPSAGHHYN